MKNIVEVSDLTIIRNKKTIFDSISFKLEAGKMYFFRGINGSGKSTLFEVLSGNLVIRKNKEIAEHVHFFDNQYSLQNIEKIKERICYIPQQATFDKYITVREFFSLPFDYGIVHMPAGEKLNTYIHQYIEDNELLSAIGCKDVQDLLKKRIAKMSLGQQHIISIFGSLIGREMSSLLFLLDEPLNYLDYNNSVLVLNKINQIHLKNDNASIAICSHCQSVQNIDVAFQIKERLIEQIKYSNYTCFGIPDQNGFIRIMSECQH